MTSAKCRNQKMSKPIRTSRVANVVAVHIEQMILQGVLRPGERLAAERDLAEKLGVSRPSLRDGLVCLEERGLIRASRDGARVARFLEPLSAPLFELFADKPRVSADYFEYRRMIEIEASRLAAIRATDVDRGLIADIVARMKAAHDIDDPTQESEADAELHIAVYESAHNLVMLHVMRVLSEMLRNNVFYHRGHLYQRDGAREKLLAQHLAIAEAVLAGDPAGAAKAAEAHIRFTFETVEEIRRDADRRADSLRRLDRAQILAATEAMD